MTGAAQMLTVRVPLAVRKQRGGHKLMIAPASSTNRGPLAADTTLVKALARAFRWRRMMEAGRYGTIDELAAAEKINSSYVSRLLRLTLLAPDIVDAILDERQPDGMTLAGLMEPFSVEWERQRVRRWPPTTPSHTLNGPGSRDYNPLTPVHLTSAPGQIETMAWPETDDQPPWSDSHDDRDPCAPSIAVRARPDPGRRSHSVLDDGRAASLGPGLARA